MKTAKRKKKGGVQARASKGNVYSRGGRFYCDYEVEGKRTRRVLAALSLAAARDEAALLRSREIEISRGLRARPEPAPKPILFEKFAAEEFIELYAKPNKRSWKRDEASLKVLKRFFKGRDLRDIGAEEGERFKMKRKAEVSPSTVNRELACLKTLYAKAVEWRRVESSPFERVKKLREPEGKEKILSRDEARGLLAEAAPHIKPVIVLALSTGMRRSEILGLKWSDVDLIKAFIRIGESKSGRTRNVPMNALVFDALREMPRRGEFVFPNKTGGHVLDVKTGFKAACRRAGIKSLRFHDLRHTAASWMVEAGVDLVTVSKILGHRTIQMTMRYCHSTEQNMKAAVAALGKFFGKPSADVTRDVTVEIPRLVKDLKQSN